MSILITKCFFVACYIKREHSETHHAAFMAYSSSLTSTTIRITYGESSTRKRGKAILQLVR